jgi:hypothetical protein
MAFAVSSFHCYLELMITPAKYIANAPTVRDSAIDLNYFALSAYPVSIAFGIGNFLAIQTFHYFRLTLYHSNNLRHKE